MRVEGIIFLGVGWMGSRIKNGKVRHTSINVNGLLHHFYIFL